MERSDHLREIKLPIGKYHNRALFLISEIGKGSKSVGGVLEVNPYSEIYTERKREREVATIADHHLKAKLFYVDLANFCAAYKRAIYPRGVCYTIGRE